MDSRRTLFITALVLAVLLFQFVPIGNTGSVSAAGQCNAATFISDVTIPDGSILNSGAAFVKTWRLKNSGTCIWTNAYSAVFDSGTPLGATISAPMPASVSPGQTVDITVNMTTPVTPGHYRSNWKLTNTSGVKFGLGTLADKPFWVDINVAATPTPTMTPGASGLNLHGTVRMNGAGLAGVRIYRGYAAYPLVLVATTGTDGTYQAPFAYIPGQETVTVKAEKDGYGFEPVQTSWSHYPGLENKTVDFTAAPGSPGTFPGPGAAFDFGYRAQEATWTSGAGALQYPGVDGDMRGFVRQTNPTTFEDGTIDAIGPNLLVAPQYIYNGFIQGVYPAYTIHAGDRFRTSVGCAYGSSCYVTYRLTYRIGSGPVYSFWSWSEKNEGQVYFLDRDLSALAGQKVSFILTVFAVGPPTDDRAIWGHPRIVHTGGTVTPSNTPTATATVTTTATPVIPVPTTVTPEPTTVAPTFTPTTVTVVPPPPSPGTILDFANVCSARWVSGAGVLPCPGTDGDSRGFALPVSNPKLENGTIDNAYGLILVPQNKYNGYIQGTYPEITVQKGDRFQSIVGCAYGFSCYVTFRLDYQVGNGPLKIFWTWAEKNEGKYYRVDKDLSALAGQKVKFVLTLLATGSATNDRALWSQPRIIRPGYISPTPTLTSTSTNAPYTVTGATANVTPLNDVHYCGGPNPVDISGTITTNGPTTVTFHWEMRGDKSNTTSDETLVFTSAGTQTIREGAYKVDCGNYSARLVITSPNSFDAIAYYSIQQATETPSPSSTTTPTATATPPGNVSNITVAVNVPEFVNCANIMTVGSVGMITTSGPATVIYHWETGSTTPQIGPDTTLVFSSATSQTSNNYPFGAGCGDQFARLVVTSPNAISAQANFSPIKPTVLPIYDFSVFHTVIGTMECSEVASYTWSAETGNGESGGYMVSHLTPLFGKSYAGFLRVDGNSICNLNLP